MDGAAWSKEGRHLGRVTHSIGRWRLLEALGGEDSGDAGEIVGYPNVGPCWGVEERLDCGERVVT